MIPLNTRQGLPSKAFWYVALRSLVAAIGLVLIGRVLQMAPAGSCRGLLCGTTSNGPMSVVIYLIAALLVVNALLRFKWFWFVLTEKNISINSGVLVRKSCTIRLDRIQDINTFCGPLQLLLGLKSVAIWTASLDQRSGKVNRPDGLIVLETDTADWLREYLSDPAAAGVGDSAPSRNRPAAALPSAPPQGNAGLVAALIVAALVVAGLVGLWRVRTPSPVAAAPPAATNPAAPPAAAASARLPTPSPGRVQPMRAAQPAANAHAAASEYGLSCAIRKSLDGVKLCGDLKQAGRCEHESDFASRPMPEPAVLTVVNRSDETVKFYWLDSHGARALYATLAPGGHVNQPSHIGAHWLVSTQDDRCIGIFSADTMAVGIF
jgi:membrane protein YdbS with pleckstrin-like domain